MDTRSGELVTYDPQSDFQVQIPPHLLEQALEVAAKGLKLWDPSHEYNNLRAWALANMGVTKSVSEKMQDAKLKEEIKQALSIRDKMMRAEKNRRKKLKKMAKVARKRNR